MRVIRASHKDRGGKQRKSAKWYLDFADHNQLRPKSVCEKRYVILNEAQ
ncbi:MAG: hypothetical protein AABZ06_11670 [Bdellovibrionota bacterium]